MESKKLEEVKLRLIDQLNLLAEKNTFLTIDDILNHPGACNLPLDDLDRVCETLLNQGIIINLSTSGSTSELNLDDVISDRSRTDYDVVFDRVINIDNSLAPYINQIRQIPFPRSNEERQLLVRAREGNSYARNRLLEMFLKVVVRIALWYYDKYSLSLSDTIQDGNVGLVIALDKIPLSPDYRFSTYAPWWIRQNIDRNASHNFNEAFCFPSYIQMRLIKLIEIQKAHICNSCGHGYRCRDLIDSISESLSIDRETVFTYLDYIKEPISIESYFNIRNDGLVFSDNQSLIEDVETNLYHCQLQIRIAEVLDLLPARDADILGKRYGVGVEEPMTLDAIAGEYGLTRERIRQIEEKIVRNLKRQPVKDILLSLL